MIDAARFRVQSRHGPEGARLELAGELDIATAPQVEAAVGGVLERRPARVEIDMRGLTFVDSSGLRMFILLAERARVEGWELALVRPGDQTMAVFRLTGAEENLPFVSEQEGA